MHRLELAEFRRSARWYAERSEKVARQFLEAVLDTVDSIESDPLRFASYDDGHRHAKVQGFPFVLIFQNPKENKGLVVAVAHTSRRPGYWKRRK
jgi:plasmid stabilization system protein ParE